MSRIVSVRKICLKGVNKLYIENAANVSEREMIREWNMLKEAIDHEPALRSITIKAWDRCKKHNVDPEKLKFVYLEDEELKKKLIGFDFLVQTAKSYLEYLSLSLTGIPHVVALLDSEGWVLDIKGPVEDFGGKKNGQCAGACWKEEYIGNNGGGTCLLEDESVFIYGMEHYGNIYKPFSCLGVPIHRDNKLIGAISIVVLNEYAHPARLTIAMACVDAIEKEIAGIPSKPKTTKGIGKSIATAELMATAVHDLKNPLASIRGLAQLGTLTSTSKKEHGYFDRIIKQVDALHRSVVDLQNIFKPEARVELQPAEIIRQVIEEIQPDCEMNNIKLSFINCFGGKLKIHHKVFKRALENLVKNAVQVITRDGKIEIEISDQNNDVLISVNDNGPGIPDEIKEKLFQPFVYHRKDGTGLGLFMVYHAITEVHDGEIWFESTAGKGTTFYIKLPKD